MPEHVAGPHDTVPVQPSLIDPQFLPVGQFVSGVQVTWQALLAVLQVCPEGQLPQLMVLPHPSG